MDVLPIDEIKVRQIEPNAEYNIYIPPAKIVLIGVNNHEDTNRRPKMCSPTLYYIRLMISKTFQL